MVSRCTALYCCPCLTPPPVRHPYPPAAAEQEGQAPYSWFLIVAISTGVGAIAIFVGIMVYCRWRRLI